MWPIKKEMLNRKVGPAITTNFRLQIQDVETTRLANGLELYELNTGSQEIIKIELVFRKGRIHEKRPAVAKAAVKLMREASLSRNAEETARFFDFHGAVIKSECYMEYASLSLICLTKHFKDLWSAFLECLQQPSYETEDLEKYVDIGSKKLREQLAKNDVVAYRLFTEQIFGKNHPYGYNTELEDILALTVDDLRQYFADALETADKFAVMSGHYSAGLAELVKKDLSRLPLRKDVEELTFPPLPAEVKYLRQETDNKHQASIKLGRIWVPRHNNDFIPLRFLNTVLGGYFGSRLMKNIREEKAYTYGIYSAFDAWLREGYFYVSSDVGADYVEPTIKEIMKEIRQLKEKAVEEAEIRMVKNYLLGQSLNLIDGPFATAHLVKSIRAKNLPLSSFELAVEEIKHLNSQQLLELAYRYFDTDHFTTVIVGG